VEFNLPQGVAVDSSDRIVAAETSNHRIQVFDSSGTFLFKFGSFGTGDGEFNLPFSAAVDSTNRIIVADGFNHRVQVFSTTP